MSEEIRLANALVDCEIETLAVVDVDSDCAVIGLEVLDVTAAFGSRTPRSCKRGVMRIDEHENALYLRLREAQIAAQEVCTATFGLSVEDEIVSVRLERPLPSAR